MQQMNRCVSVSFLSCSHRRHCCTVLNRLLHAAGAASAARGPAFESTEPRVLQQLQQLLVVLTALQQADQKSDFEALQQASGSAAAAAVPPLLWAAIQFAEPLGQWLRAVFGNNTPLGDIDRPEWLFATVLKVLKQTAPLVERFQVRHIVAWG